MKLAALVALFLLTGCATDDGIQPLRLTGGDLQVGGWDGLTNGNGPQRSLTGVYVCQAYGTWGGATLTLQKQRADGTWEAITAPTQLVAATADTDDVTLLAGQRRYRPDVSGGTGEDLTLDCGRAVY